MCSENFTTETNAQDQPQCPRLWHSSTPNARFLSHSPSAPPPPFTQSPYPPRSLVRDGQTHPHRPRIVVSHSTCPPLSSSPHTHSFVIGPAVIKHTQFLLAIATKACLYVLQKTTTTHCHGGECDHVLPAIFLWFQWFDLIIELFICMATKICISISFAKAEIDDSSSESASISSSDWDKQFIRNSSLSSPNTLLIINVVFVVKNFLRTS